MKLKVQPYNSGASSYNAETEETKFRTYTLEHEFNEPARAIITLADVDGSMMRKYNVGTGAVGGAVADDGGAEVDKTTETNNVAPNDMPLLPAAPELNDAYYFGFSRPFGGLLLNVSTVANAVGLFVITWEYSTGADAWTALSDVVDGTNKYQNAGLNTISWTMPDDWATDTVGAIAGLYWVRGRLTDNAAWTVVPVGQQAWIGGTYLGVGKITIEDPDGTDYFYGRIVNVVGTSAHPRTLTLECRDWLDQLDEKQITYDMREKLSGNIRQSKGHADPDGAFVDVAQNDAGTYYFYDDAMAWANDVYNGQYLILTSGMAGSIKVKTGPYTSSFDWDGGTHANSGTFSNLWAEPLGFAASDADDDFKVIFEFRTYVGHNTPSDFYVHDSITGARIHWSGSGGSITGAGRLYVEVWTGAAYTRLEEYQGQATGLKEDKTFEIPLLYVDDVVDANGIVKVRFYGDHNGELTEFQADTLFFEVDVETTGYSTAVLINDTITTNKLEVATDLTAAATRVWEQVPYCIAQPIFKHIASDEGGTLITGGDNIVTLTCAATIEHTSGISTRQYKEKTRLYALNDLAIQDKVSFWMVLGTTTLIYKQTFGADTQQLTDGDVLDWRSMYDYNQMTNEYHIYGARIGDYEIYQSQQNAASVAKYKATRTKTERRAGVVSDYEAKALATGLAARDAELLQMVACTIAGNTATAAHATTIKLGEIVEITSSYLWPTAAKDYIVTRFAYNSIEHKTYLTLHPKVSIGLQEIDIPDTRGENVKQSMKAAESDKYVPDPITHEVA